MLESAFQKKVLKYLREEVGGYWVKIHVSSYQLEGEPDIMGCYKGKFYAFELKQGNNTTTPLQDYKLEQIRKNGGTAMVIRSLDQLRKLFECD